MNFISPSIYWLAYPFLLLFLFALVSSLFVVCFTAISPELFKKFAPFYKPISGKRIRFSDLFFAIAAATAFVFLFSNMFLKFNAYDLEAERIRLHFFWPKTDVVIQRGNYLGFDLNMDRKGRGVLSVFANGRMYKSTPFDRLTDTNSIVKRFSQWKDEVH